ncbi:MAG: response regulator transcription factor [Bacilli bacterium]|jgi:LuxR family transcriptional regulator of spore coat protein|nr:response regulator transcription factor [Bacilli bacterium]
MDHQILTPREKEIFDQLIEGKNSKEIAEYFFISDKTVRNHISNVMQKLEVKTRYQAIIELLKMGELEIK